MADVFISYSKTDRAVAEELATCLRLMGYEVWWDFQLVAGDDFHDTIRQEIGKAKRLL
jgi:TIR domain